ncbi:MAG TPA: hypothetical protein VGB78_08835 [Thermoplasmata archaeon]|jgi:RNase P subunit RPR2
MGRPQKHYPRCANPNCRRTLPHYLMVEVRLKGGRKVHYCVSCHEAYMAKMATGG